MPSSRLLAALERLSETISLQEPKFEKQTQTGNAAPWELMLEVFTDDSWEWG
ncbi:MAG TPA: hypothetical protein VMJ32_08390 [Pirellulales bacterium]|nr:hypothetical protein [Pirellulales bacterium]